MQACYNIDMLSDDKKIFKDEEILAASIKSPSLFAILVDKYQAPFLRTANKIVNHKEESEDIVQEAFTKIYSNADRFKKREGASFKSWAYKILLNTSFVHYKKIKRLRESIQYVDPSFYDYIPDNNSGNIELNIEMKITVAKIMQKLPKHFQKALRMYYLEDKSQKDIAAEENVSVATIKMRLFRAKKVLKKILDNEKLLCPTKI